ncbi:MAG: RNA methyltransferase [Bacteroidota bacterium]
MLSKTYTKYIQSLHHKKSRDAEHCFIAEGNKVVLELLHAKHFICEQLLGREEWMKEHEPEIRRFYKGPLQVIDFSDLEKISALSTPNNVLGIFRKSDPVKPVLQDRLVLALDTIQDPGNLGTIIRIADWFNIKDIICSENCVELYNPKVVQSTMGSLSRVNVTYTNLAQLIQAQANLPTYAAALNGTALQQLPRLTSGILIVGNESKGISEEVLQLAKQKITIPRFGAAESLNAAVATGIILSHLVKN